MGARMLNSHNGLHHTTMADLNDQIAQIANFNWFREYK